MEPDDGDERFSDTLRFCCCFLIAQRYFLAGMTAGSVKA